MAKTDRPRLSPAAEHDLEAIWDYTALTWSRANADAYIRSLFLTFDAIVAFPDLGRELPEIAPPVRVHPHRSHMIIYRNQADHIEILRIPHTRQNWINLLRD
jgi:toxin ParE1/3/4